VLVALTLAAVGGAVETVAGPADRWFEPNTCHHQQKRPANCDFSR
jgi:hypothetical protein